MNLKFTIEEIKMADKHMKRSSNTLIIRKVQPNKLMRHDFKPIKIAKTEA